MYSQTLVFAALLLGGPPEPPNGPRLEKGLEVRWTGTFTEASFRPGVRAIRNYDVDTRLFVIDTGEHGADAEQSQMALHEVLLHSKLERSGAAPRQGAWQDADELVQNWCKPLHHLAISRGSACVRLVVGHGADPRSG